MPLPANGTAWPPAELADVMPAIEAWDAWWVGDTDGLHRAYQGKSTARVRPGQLAGGVVGAVSRFFWGRPQLDQAQTQRKLHVPIATDLCQASADLLWSEAPTFTVDDETTQERLDKLVDDGMLATLTSGAEVGAAHGGHFLRVTWDVTVSPDRPFLTRVDADGALPEFRWGRLVAVTFWHVVAEDNTKVLRHLERHELDAGGIGVIIHGLYAGTRDSLGQAVPLKEHKSTAGLEVDAESSISTGSPGLAVEYVPNLQPQRLWRRHPIGKDLGRSDLDGVEGLMDALDEVYTSWMRDIRLAKARLLVPQPMLVDNGPGSGASFDLDQEIFAPVNAPPTSLTAANTIAQAEQFAIRHEEHRATSQALLEDILRTAGYSPATFGLDVDGAAMTATEIKARQQRSFMTRDRKLRAVRPALSRILEKLLAVDAEVFNSGVTPARPDVEFPDGVQESLLSLAQTAQALRTAEAASTMTLVQMMHPEWDDQQVTDEVALIMGEQPAPMADPTDPGLASGTVAPPAPDSVA